MSKTVTFPILIDWPANVSQAALPPSHYTTAEGLIRAEYWDLSQLRHTIDTIKAENAALISLATGELGGVISSQPEPAGEPEQAAMFEQPKKFNYE